MLLITLMVRMLPVYQARNITYVEIQGPGRVTLNCTVDPAHDGLITWDALYGNDAYERHTCYRKGHGGSGQCTFSTRNLDVRPKTSYGETTVICLCNYIPSYIISVDVFKAVPSVHSCYTERNSDTVSHTFIFLPKTFIQVRNSGLRTRKIACCVTGFNDVLVESIDITQNNGSDSEPYVRQGDCVIHTSFIDYEEEHNTTYTCRITLNIWGTTVSKKHVATVTFTTDVVRTSNKTVVFANNGLCSGHVTLMYSGCTSIPAQQTPLTYVQLNYSNSGKNIYRSDETSIVIDVGQCVNNTAAINVDVSILHMRSGIYSCIFYHGEDMDVYETHIIDRPTVDVYDIDGTSYINFTMKPNYLNETSHIIALLGCDGTMIDTDNSVTFLNARDRPYACIVVDGGCGSGTAWIIRNESIQGPLMIENVTSYMERVEHCIDDQSSSSPFIGTDIHMVLYTLIYFNFIQHG